MSMWSSLKAKGLFFPIRMAISRNTLSVRVRQFLQSKFSHKSILPNVKLQRFNLQNWDPFWLAKMGLRVVSTMVELWPLGQFVVWKSFSWFFLYIEKCWKRYLLNACFKHAHNAQPLPTSKIPLQLMGKVYSVLKKLAMTSDWITCSHSRVKSLKPRSSNTFWLYGSANTFWLYGSDAGLFVSCTRPQRSLRRGHTSEPRLAQMRRFPTKTTINESFLILAAPSWNETM